MSEGLTIAECFFCLRISSSDFVVTRVLINASGVISPSAAGVSLDDEDMLLFYYLVFQFL